MGTREEPELCYVWQLYREVWILRCFTNCIFVTLSCVAAHTLIEIATPSFLFRLHGIRTQGETVRCYGLPCWQYVRSAQLYVFLSKGHSIVTELIRHLEDVSRWLHPYLRHYWGRKSQLINGHLYLILFEVGPYAMRRFGSLLGITLTWHQTSKHAKNSKRKSHRHIVLASCIAGTHNPFIPMNRNECHGSAFQRQTWRPPTSIQH